MGNKRQFTDWVKQRIADCGFQGGVDFLVLKNEYGGIIEKIDYWLTIDAAKHFAMMERNEIGKTISDIEVLNCTPKFADLNFEVSSYKDKSGKSNKMYFITRDGFSMLAMGFTGKEAALWKEAYIAAFNAMEKKLREQSHWGRGYVDGNRGK